MTVNLFATAKDLANAEAVTLQLPAGATVATLRQVLVEQIPTLSSLLPRCLIAVNQEFATDSVMLAATDEIAVIPPVSGGSL